ncbi:DNA-binding PadR family transcriptional regulator [Novosphingobium sp. PhB165]|nr:DNA-binding PadR family transcriptional regulator [Novosphingobium sp. PhB165]
MMKIHHKRGHGRGCGRGERSGREEFGAEFGGHGFGDRRFDPRGMRGRGGFGMERGPFGRDGDDFEGGFPGGRGRGRGGRGEGFGGGFGGGFGPGGGRMGGRRKRLFEQAELQVLLLALIVEAPRHGYELIREIEALSGGDYAPSPGVVYPALTYMEEAGLISAKAEEGARKSYEATDEGRKQAETDAEKAVELKARLSALAEARDKVDPAPVRRAIHALRTAMHDRLSKDGANREVILQIADALDEATRKIERIEV